MLQEHLQAHISGSSSIAMGILFDDKLEQFAHVWNRIDRSSRCKQMPQRDQMPCFTLHSRNVYSLTIYIKKKMSICIGWKSPNVGA